MKQIIGLILLLVSTNALCSPCAGVDRRLSDAQRHSLVPALERHLNNQLGQELGQVIRLSAEDVFKSFRVGKWHIVYLNSHVSDEPFLFYSSAPSQAERYITAWAGAATSDEGPAIYAWVRHEAPGIPKKLASCFAWYVTKSGDY